MTSPRWTRAGVRHRGPRWYWVRWCDGDDPFPTQMYTTTNGVTWVLGGYGWTSWLEHEGAERWSAPIEEPEG